MGSSNPELNWATWTGFEKDCAENRVWAGAHFKKTAEASLAFGAQFGDLTHEFVQRYVCRRGRKTTAQPSISRSP
ncbi:hypothetical protein ACWD1Y_45150 [Streptomyces sp. NPDC002814]